MSICLAHIELGGRGNRANRTGCEESLGLFLSVDADSDRDERELGLPIPSVVVTRVRGAKPPLVVDPFDA